MVNNIIFRNAEEKDLMKIVEMLSDDILGKTRENYQNPLPKNYIEAFQQIDKDPNNELIAACIDNEVVGTAQVTFIPYITHQGGWRATIEGVRTSASVRGKGVGSKLINYAVERAKARDCHLVQLTTDKKREEALHFYEKLGFSATHEGMKLKL